jgi:hypothetical protein
LCLSVGNRKNPIKNALARAAKFLLSLEHRTVRWCTGQCPVRQADSGEQVAHGNSPATYDYNSPDCPVSQRSAARSARDTWLSQRLDEGTGLSGVHRTGPVRQRLSGCQRSAARSARDTWLSQRLDEGTGLSGVHRTCPVRQRLSGCQRSTAPFMERNRAPDMSGVHRTVRCASRQKARSAFLDCSQRLLAALGL